MVRHAVGPHSVYLDTCFALLFLQRANLARDLSDKLRELLGAGARLRIERLPPVGPRREEDGVA
jgi:hypothetical protein